MFRHTNVPTHQCSDTPMFWHSIISTFEGSDTPMFRLTNVPTFEYSDIRGFRHTNVPTFKYSDIQRFRHTNVPTPPVYFPNPNPNLNLACNSWGGCYCFWNIGRGPEGCWTTGVLLWSHTTRLDTAVWMYFCMTHNNLLFFIWTLVIAWVSLHREWFWQWCKTSMPL